MTPGRRRIAARTPPVMLLCGAGDPEIIRGLAKVAQRCAAAGRSVRMCVSDDASEQRRALFAPVRWIVWDDHGYPGPDQVLFGTGDRCVLSPCDPISADYVNWPDVPYHAQYCAVGGACTGASMTAPSFWSTVALKSVTTQQWNGTRYVAADSWALTQTLPAQSDGTQNLWLASVARTGLDTTAGGSSPPPLTVSFFPVEEANRVNPGTSTPMDLGLRYTTDITAAKFLVGNYPILRWTDRWGTRREHKQGVVVRKIAEGEPWAS